MSVFIPCVGTYVKDVLRDTEEDCNICDEKLVDETVNKKRGDPFALSCQHIFHLECIRSWTKREKSCPVCRQPITYLPPPSAPEESQPSPPQSPRHHRHHHRSESPTCPPCECAAAAPETASNDGPEAQLYQQRYDKLMQTYTMLVVKFGDRRLFDIIDTKANEWYTVGEGEWVDDDTGKRYPIDARLGVVQKFGETKKVLTFWLNFGVFNPQTKQYEYTRIGKEDDVTDMSPKFQDNAAYLQAIFTNWFQALWHAAYEVLKLENYRYVSKADAY